MRRPTLLCLSVAAALFAADIAYAQQPPAGIKRTPLQTVEFPDGYKTITVLAEVPAGGKAGRHTHPGIESGYILEGETDLIIEGQETRRLKAGDSYSIPAGVVHDAQVHGDKPMKFIAIYIIDKTKPLVAPAP